MSKDTIVLIARWREENILSLRTRFRLKKSRKSHQIGEGGEGEGEELSTQMRKVAKGRGQN